MPPVAVCELLNSTKENISGVESRVILNVSLSELTQTSTQRSIIVNFSETPSHGRELIFLFLELNCFYTIW